MINKYHDLYHPYGMVSLFSAPNTAFHHAVFVHESGLLVSKPFLGRFSLDTPVSSLILKNRFSLDTPVSS